MSLSDSEMQHIEFFDWKLEVDPPATRTATVSWSSPDPACCNACATFAAVAERHVLPPEVERFLGSVGLDVRVPQELWGAPDGGFLSAWWVFVGSLVTGPPGALEGGYVEPAPGFRCWVTNDISMGSPPDFGGHPLLQFEFSWESSILVDLEKEVWNARARSRGTPPN